MPELPEVENVRRRLVPALAGARIADARITDSRLTRPHDPALVAAELVGELVTKLHRRGKYLLVRFESGRCLLAHLRMTGSFRARSEGEPVDDHHLRAVLSMDNGSDVTYHDVRRFGTWELFEPGEVDAYLAERLGPEPLGPLTAAGLQDRLAGRRAPLKAALLDQRVVAGLGNIYVDEALWRAQLHPRRVAGGLRPPEARSLHRSVRAVLRRAITRQGSTLRDYVTPNGEAGRMQEEFAAYGRAGEPCRRCGQPLERAVVGGRGTAFCGTCQRL
jgi:formamidopyrimidine-DNA glycosylase